VHHRDPFDRLLISQARQRGAELMTSDRHFERYDVRVVRADR
jgi:PIN domain nuclease of toxin-antitoxin system